MKRILILGLLAATVRAELTLTDIFRWGIVRKADLVQTDAVPVFELDLAWFDAPSNTWRISAEVELKCTTNNVWTAPLYWGDTSLWSGPSYTNAAFSDFGLAVYFPDPEGTETRAYGVFRPGVYSNDLPVTLGDRIGTAGLVPRVLCVPSITDRSGKRRAWMRPDNRELMWVYRPRGVASGGPVTETGQLLWYPCVPKEWKKAGFYGETR